MELLVEDDKNRISWFKKRIKDLDVAENAEDAIDKVAKIKYTRIWLDHDLGGRVFVDSSDSNTGYAVAKTLAGSVNSSTDVVIHSMNPVGAANIASLIPHARLLVFGTFDIKD